MISSIAHFTTHLVLPEDQRERLANIWNQRSTPVAFRPIGPGLKLRVRLPYAENNRGWLQHGRRAKPQWHAEHKYWQLPKSWFNDFVDRCLLKFGRVYIIQTYRQQEKCAPACQQAVGHECTCSCMGANHGRGNDGTWFEVSNTFATRWLNQQLACRLITNTVDL